MTDGDADIVLEHIDVGYLLVDLDGIIVAANPAAASLLGVDNGLDSTHIDELPPEVCDQFDTAPPGDQDPVDVTLTTDGEHRTLEFDRIAVDHHDANQLALLRDVTARTTGARQLERYETLLETIPDTVVVTDTDGRLVEIHGFEGWSGYEEDELIGEPFSKTATAEAVEVSEDHIAELFAADDREKVTYEMDVITADGEQIRHENHLALLPPEQDGRIPGSMSVLRNVSERKERERALEALNAATRELLIAKSVDDIVEKAVATAVEVLDLPLTGVFLHDPNADALVPASYPDADELPDDPPTFRPGESVAWEVFEAGETRVFDDLAEHDALHNPDTEIRSEIIVPLGDHGVLMSGSTEAHVFDQEVQNLAGVLGAAVATALDRLERDHEREAQRRELRRKNERLERFASVVSHDLRNPLNVAHGRVDLALQSGDVEALAGAGDALDRMETLIEDLLALARQGASIGARDPVSIDDVATDAWGGVESSSASLSIETDCTVDADRARLRELFENLFRNAVEHAGPTVDIRLGALDDGTGFFVEDDGPGIDHDDQSAVFEHGVTGSADGTGLGLAIVEDIADAHGWSARVTTGTAGGARFEFETADATERD